MGILSSLKQFNDARNQKKDEARSARREARIHEIESFIKKEYDVHAMGTERILGSIGDTGIFDLDRTIKASAPMLTTMLEEIYLNQERVSQMHELEGRYAELKERYDELKKEHDTLILALTQKEQRTR